MTEAFIVKCCVTFCISTKNLTWKNTQLLLIIIYGKHPWGERRKDKTWKLKAQKSTYKYFCETDDKRQTTSRMWVWQQKRKNIKMTKNSRNIFITWSFSQECCSHQIGIFMMKNFRLLGLRIVENIFSSFFAFHRCRWTTSENETIKISFAVCECQRVGLISRH